MFIMFFECVNFNPHPYCITLKHVAVAADNWGGMLGADAIADAETKGAHCSMYTDPSSGKCGVKRTATCTEPCHLPYSMHTSDRAMFVALTRDCDSKEISGVLFPLKESLTKDGISGCVFEQGSFKVTDWDNKKSKEEKQDGKKK